MKPHPDTLSLIRDSFPGRHQLIDRAYRGNRPFRELCDDFLKCARALERWRQLEANGTGPRRQEYTELLAELRGEIQTWLEAMDTGSYATRGRDS